MKARQHISWGLFIGGLAALFYSVYELLHGRSTWRELTASPDAVSNIVLTLAMFCSTVAGALGIDVGRVFYGKTRRIGDRKPDIEEV